MEIDRRNFSRGDESSRVIATLESLAVLLALKALYTTGTEASRRKIRLQPTWTDNRGSGAALNKLVSTQYPINAVLTELAVHCMHNLDCASCETILPTVGQMPSRRLLSETGPGPASVVRPSSCLRNGTRSRDFLQ